MMSYINETDFVIENKKLVYPEIVADGLQLYYDSKGKRDTDYHRDTMLDMSGNKNHGKLHNFAYEKHSGYKDGLVFDYIDDKLVRPTLDLQPNDLTFMLNGNIISFSPDGTVKRVQDGEVIESKGFNMLYDMENTSYYGLDVKYNYNQAQAIWTNKAGNNTFLYSTTRYEFKDKHKYYISYNAKPDGPVRLRIFANERYLDGDILSPILNEYNFRSGILEAENQYANQFNVRLLFSSDGVVGTKVDIKDLMMIDLTETFGSGNEPTKEQMDEIINRFGFIPNAQDLIDRIEYKGNDLGDMENIIDGLYKTEVLSGEEIYTDKAEDNAGVHVDIDGKSVGGGSGKNLLNGANSLMRFSGSGLINTGSRTSLKAGTYTFSVQEIKGMTKWRMYWAVFKNGILVKETSQVATHFYTGGIYYSFNGNMMYLSSSDTSQKSYTIILDDDYEIAWGFSGGDSTETSEMLYPQIELGSTATAYEPPAPTPDYPVEIHSLNDFDVVSSVGKENLLKGSQREWKSTIEYIAPSYNLNEIFDKYPIGQTYTISFDAKSDDPSKRDTLQFYSNPGSTVQNKYIFATRQFTGLTTEYQRFSHTITPYLSADPSFPKSGMSFYGLYDTGNIPTIRNIKIELGTTATPYTISPKDIVGSDNQTSIDKINLLLDEPLRSVGDVKDRLFRDSDGVWKIERNVGEYIINGTNAWTVGSPGGGWTTNGDTLPLYGALDYQRMGGAWSTNSITSRFPTHPSTSGIVRSNMESFSLGYATFGIIIRIKKSRLTQETSVGFVNWLKENPINVVYELKTSKVETLSQSLQDKLNNLRSFEDSNYVYTVLPNEDNYLTDNLKPTLHAKFLYNNWYKEDRVINNLMIYNRALTNEEMLQNYKTIKRRWGM